MEPILQLESARLLMRQWQDEDLPAFAAMCADPQVMRYFPAALSRLESASLIGRMSGHGADHAPAAPAPQPARHAAPQQSAADPQDYEDEPGAAQDRIEIPAFLRRQAN